ncbi:MAG: Crp/Fnr family transcriptional regulator [Cyanobacteria bacterium P01_G01_bin.39]
MVLSIQHPSNISTEDNSRSNLLLNLLSETELQRLLTNSRRVIFTAKTTLYQPQNAIKRVYFPLQGIISLMHISEAGLIAECAAVSNEGMVGINAVFDYSFTSNFVITQTECIAIAIPVNAIKREFNRGGKLQRVLLLYSQARLAQAYQNVFCSCHHTLEQRLARWLIYYSERLNTRDILLTQETLADLIGVRRSSLSVIAANLRQRNIIDYNRGKIEIINAKTLKAIACNCDSVISEEYDRLLFGSG